MLTDESYQDDLDLLVDRAEAAVASILIVMLLPQVADRGLYGVTAAGKFSMKSAIEKISKTAKAARLSDALKLAIMPAVIGAIDLVKKNEQLAGVYELARSIVESVVEKVAEYYDDKTLGSTESLEDTAMKTARWLVRDAIFQGQESAAATLQYRQKRWVTRHDDRVRASHRSLDGQVVQIHRKFTTQTGARLMFPGDISAPLSEVINCRCSVEFL